MSVTDELAVAFGTCVPPELAQRELLPAGEASRLARTFQVLANDTRLRLLHALARDGELCVGDVAAAIGTTPQATSNQLQRLVDQRIVASRREGNRIFYRVADPCIPRLLELALCLTEVER